MFREQELWLPGVREEVQEQLRPVPPPGPGPPGPEAALPLLRQTSRQHEAAHQGRSQVSHLPGTLHHIHSTPVVSVPDPDP
jgi:hypothetical protein